MVSLGNFSINKTIGVMMKLLLLDASARSIDFIQPPANADEPTKKMFTGIKAVATLGVTMARFPILKRITKGMPFGMSALINGLMSISAIQIAVGQIPYLISLFTPSSGAPLPPPTVGGVGLRSLDGAPQAMVTSDGRVLSSTSGGETVNYYFVKSESGDPIASGLNSLSDASGIVMQRGGVIWKSVGSPERFVRVS